MVDQDTVDTSLDPSGYSGPEEHGPPDATDGSKRMITSSVWGGFPANVNSENGQDVSPWNPSCSWYQYGKNYGLNGCQHPGMDIGISFGTALHAAAGGKVVFAGPDKYYKPHHVNILTNNGEVHIYGHMSAVDPSVQAGGQVQAGQFIGKSGTENGDHLHFERRVPSNNCSSGYCAMEVDTVLVGAEPAEPFAIGDVVKVVDPPLNLRASASLAAEIIQELTMDAELTINSAPEQADGYEWYAVSVNGGDKTGWVAGVFCRLS